MSDIENFAPKEMKGQLNKGKEASKVHADGSKTPRTPFKDIGNKSSNKITSPLMEKGLSPTKFEAIQSLDDEENWQDRTEVITKLDHTKYKIIAREIVEDAIEKLPGMRESCQTPAELKFAKMSFRERPSKNMDDSVLDLDETISLPQLDDTITLPRTESKLTVPVANSTLLNTTCTSPRSPNQSDTVFENSLLSSFEKMQIKGVKGALVDDDEEDVFHDASDDFDSFSTSPVKNQRAPISKQAAEQLDDPFDMLMSCMEKITVNDKNTSILAEKVECIDNVESAQLPSKYSKEMPFKVEGLQVDKSEVRSGPILDVNDKAYSEKKDFSDPDFNPFLTRKSTGSNTNSKDPKVSPVGVMSMNEGRGIICSDINQACDGNKMDAKKSTQSKSQVTENRPLEENQASREVSNTDDNNDLKTHLSQSTSPDTEALPGNLEEKREAIPAAKHTEKNIELQHRQNDSKTLEDSKVEHSQDTDLNLDNIVAPKDENTSKDMVIKPYSEEASIAPPKRSYDLDRIMKLSDDPAFNPFAPHSCIVNSPDLEGETQGNEDTEVAKSFDYGGNGLHPMTEDIPSRKDYSFEIALDKIQDPNFDPFLPKNLIVNSPDIVGEALFEADDASKIHNDCVTKSKPSAESELTACDASKSYDDNVTKSKPSAESELTADDASKSHNDNVTKSKPSAESELTVDDASKSHNDNVTKSKLSAESELTACKTDPTEMTITSGFAIAGSSTGVSSLEKNNEISAKLPIVEKPVSQDNLEAIVSPKRKYDEAFTGEMMDYDEELLAMKEATGPPEKGGNEKIDAKTAEQKTEDPVSESQQEEIIPPKKGYNLDFLDKLEESDFDPFTTKASVSNSPGTEARGSKPIKTALIKKKDPFIAKGTSNPHVSKSEMTTTIKEAPEIDVNSSALQKHVDNENDINTSVVLSNKSNKTQNKEGETASVPVYKLDTLDNLNDISSKHPAVEKSVSHDNPEGAVSPKRKYDEAFTGEKEDYDEELLAMKEAIEPSYKGSEENMDAKTAEQKTEDPVSESQQEEIIPPKKGYNLDFLDKLEESDFDPFTTKASVSNSPGTEARGSKPIKTALIKKKDPVIAKGGEPKAIASCKKEGTSDPNVNKSELTTTVKEVSETGGNSSTLQKHVDNESNINMSDLSRNSNKTQNKEEENTPEEEGPASPSKEKEDTLSEEKVSQTSDKSGKGKARLLKKAVKPSIKKVPFVNSKVEESQVNSKEKEEEEIPLPKKVYQLDFLDNLDDPNFNPFATKTSVANSPDKNKESNTVQKQETVDEEARPQNKAKNASEADVLNESEIKADSAASIRYENDIKVEQMQEPSSDASTSKQELKQCVEKKMDGISVPGNDCQLDDASDRNLNQFQSKTSVPDTPKKVSFAALGGETTARGPMESKQGSSDEEEKMTNDSTTKCKIDSPTVELCPSESSSNQLSSKPISNPAHSSASDDMFESITKEAMRLVAEVTPKKQPIDRKIVQASAQVRQRDVFSPQFAQSGVSEDPRGAYNFDEFVDATDFCNEQQEPLEGEIFHSAITYPLFSNPEDLDALSEHGKDGDKLNLVRNSLYVKFDPLVSGRQSLAPYLAQQKVMQKEESDPRRSSALMCFSPSPDKKKRGGNAKGLGTPVRPLLRTRADETVVMEATTNMTLNETTVCEGHNSTVVVPSSTTAFNTTIISQGGNFNDDTIFQEPAVPEEKMIPEREMLKKIKEIEQTAELIMQDKLLRQSRVLEEVNREMKQQMEESEIALAGMEEENSNLRSTIQQLQAMLLKVVEQGKKKSEEGERDLFLLENKYDLECKALKEEVKQHQEELKKVESQFHDLIKKYIRLQEVTEAMRRNEEVLKAEKEALHTKFIKKEESFTAVLKALEEKYNDAQQEFQQEKGKHEHENARLVVLVKKAEVKILSLTETVEKKTTEIERLTALIDDITSKFG